MSHPSKRREFFRHVAQTSGSPRALEIVRTSGSSLWDTDGNEYLDLLAGIGVASIGHSHPAVAVAAAEQARRFTHVMVYGEDILAPQVELAERLSSLLPAQLSVAYLTNSGTEAIEGCLKLVRKATGRSRVLAFEGAFHGDTTGSLALGGNPHYREPFRPLLPEVGHLPWDSELALEQIDESIAAVFAEPVQAEAGVRIPSPGFLPALARRCREVGALLVLDEVVTGLGRTGRWFGFEHWPGAEPDILVLAKSLGGGLPIGAFIASPQLMRVLAHDPALGHVTTFGGNPVSCAAALAALDVLQRDHLVERAARVGTSFATRLRERIGSGGLIAVRGLGLLIGLEFESASACAQLVEQCRAERVLVGWTLHADRVVRLAPPLVIRDHEIDRALQVIDGALAGSAQAAGEPRPTSHAHTSSGAGRHAATTPPSPWIQRFAEQIPRGGTVLDVAAGGGRHTRELAARGHKVIAVDRDLSALADLISPLEPPVGIEIELVQANLEDGSPWPFPGRQFDGVVVTNYLHRPLLQVLIASVAPGGVLLYETFARGNERFGFPKNPDFLLAPGELLEAVRGSLDVIAYEHTEITAPRPAVVQRIAARRRHE